MYQSLSWSSEASAIPLIKRLRSLGACLTVPEDCFRRLDFEQAIDSKISNLDCFYGVQLTIEYMMYNVIGWTYFVWPNACSVRSRLEKLTPLPDGGHKVNGGCLAQDIILQMT